MSSGATRCEGLEEWSPGMDLLHIGFQGGLVAAEDLEHEVGAVAGHFLQGDEAPGEGGQRQLQMG